MKKSQASMEFLLTYGWAIVAAVVVLAALSYFGVLDATGLARLMPDTCRLPPGLTCRDFSLRYYEDIFNNPKNEIDFLIRNNKGFEIESVTVNIPQGGGGETVINGDDLGNNKDFQIHDAGFTYNGQPFMKGDRYDIEFDVTVTMRESGLTHTEIGLAKGFIK